MAKNNISGLFSDLLEKVAHWFLYIFIAADAQLPKAVMDKRKRQIDWLKRIDKLNTYYDYLQLQNIINQGIMKRYGMKPADVLQKIYNSAIATIGATAPEDRVEQLTLTDKTTGEKKNFWSDVSNVIVWLIELLQKIGVGTKRETWNSSTPTSGDWANMNLDGYNKSAGVGKTIPYLIAGVAAYYLFTKK